MSSAELSGYRRLPCQHAAPPAALRLVNRPWPGSRTQLKWEAMLADLDGTGGLGTDSSGTRTSSPAQMGAIGCGIQPRATVHPRLHISLSSGSKLCNWSLPCSLHALDVRKAVTFGTLSALHI